jgi:hypothetical protein
MKIIHPDVRGGDEQPPVAAATSQVVEVGQTLEPWIDYPGARLVVADLLHAGEIGGH